MTAPAVQHAVDAAFGEERGRVVATLIRRTGGGDLAGECAQEAFTGPLRRWPRSSRNGYYSAPPGSPETTQDGCIAARFLSFAAIAADRPDNAGTTPATRGRDQVTGHSRGVAGGDLRASGAPAAPPGRLRSEPGWQADHPFSG